MAASAPYRQALSAFQQRDYVRALSLSERPPESAGSGERADLLNLRQAPATPSAEESMSTGTPSFGDGTPPASREDLPAADAPPTGPGLLPVWSNNDPSAPASVASASVLARPRRSRNTPTPTPTATPSPSETPDTQSGTASPAPTATAAPSATPSAEASPVASPSPEFIKKYEAAYVAFLKKDYAATVSLLDEADKIQPKQPQAVTLRKQVFKQEYEAAYLAFRKGDYQTALTQLDAADLAQPNYPDALNLRGLVYSKQHAYDQAETMFKKAVEADPTLWAAKFNYAELPFNRGDYTTARSRFENLLGETDNAKLPREYELTQYKVFLTLLLEGKTDQARSFMDHFNFSGATPAKYFCNAAMQFRAGSTEKALGWINSAKREYPAQLVTIFIESFYRLGWMSDPNAPASGTAVANATPAASPAVEAVAPGATPTPGAAVSASPALAVATPPPVAAPSPVTAPTVLLAASSSPSVEGVPAAAATSPSGTASPAAPPAVVVAKARPTPISTAAAVPTTAATPVETPTSESPTPGVDTGDSKGFSLDDALRLAIGAAVLIYGLYVFSRLLTSATRRKSRRPRSGGPPLAPVGKPNDEPAKSETPR